MSEAAGPTKRPMRPTDRVLNVWASARRHEAAVHEDSKGEKVPGRASPIKYEEVFEDVGPLEPRTDIDCTRAAPQWTEKRDANNNVVRDENGEAVMGWVYPYYQATPKKYEQVPDAHQDARVLAAIEAVEYSLGLFEAPAWFWAYLLFRYPETGRYAQEHEGPDPAREFVDLGGMREVTGGNVSPGALGSARSLVRSTYRQFVQQLVGVMGLDDGGRKEA